MPFGSEQGNRPENAITWHQTRKSAQMARPLVGIGAIVARSDSKVLVGKRKGSHGGGKCDTAGTWQLPGGHLEYGEEVLACAEREVLEETALVVKGASTVAVTNSVFEREQKHYITLFAYCEMTDPDALPQLTEPNKCEGWHWKTWEELIALKGNSKPGEVVFLPLHKLLEQTPNFDDLKPAAVASRSVIGKLENDRDGERGIVGGGCNRQGSDSLTSSLSRVYLGFACTSRKTQARVSTR
ncbi:Nudix hydrolase [Paramyrothecium foliicola]|nr:Nudix hydrolase [Paramyrothecium foliicola]